MATEYLDIAVLGKDTFTIGVMSESHILTLQTKTMTEVLFKEVFFKNDAFSVNLLAADTNPLLTVANFSLVDFNGQTLDDGTTLNLADKLIEFASEDLGIPETSITPITRIELYKECKNLNLASLKILSSVKWQDISDVIATNEFVITAVFSNKNCNIQNVCIRFLYDVTPTPTGP
jgi:hypothetical protein